MEEVASFPDVRSLVQSIESMDDPEERRFARAVGPVFRSLDRISEHEARIRSRLMGEAAPGAEGREAAALDRPPGPSPYVPPPGAGIGPTPPSSTGDGTPDVAMANMSAMHASQEASPTSLPVTQAAVDYQMQCLTDVFDMTINEHEHLEWLMATGLILPREARGVVEAIGIPHKRTIESPLVLHTQASPNTSASRLFPDVQLQFPPPPVSPPGIRTTPLALVPTPQHLQASPQEFSIMTPPMAPASPTAPKEQTPLSALTLGSPLTPFQGYHAGRPPDLPQFH